MHMVIKRDLHSAELETMRTSRTANGPEEVVEAVEVTEVIETSSQDLWLRALEHFHVETRHESFSLFLEWGRELRVFGVGVRADFFKPHTAWRW